MAKSRKTSAKTAFHFKMVTEINNAIYQLRRRVLRTQRVPVISYREMLRLIAPEEHVERLMQARDLIDIGRYTARTTDARVYLRHRNHNVGVTFEVSGEIGTPAMPRIPIWLDHFPENRDLVMALGECGRQFADITIDWDEVQSVFNYLNKVCSNPAQVRYIWPAISGLLSMREELAGLRSSLSQHVLPKSLPTLPVEVRQACRRTAATVAMALMLPPLEDDAMPTPDVEITFMITDGVDRG